MDAEIARDIKRRMKADIEVPDDRVGVKVTEGVVTIEGTVARDSQQDRGRSLLQRSERRARNCQQDYSGTRCLAARSLVNHAWDCEAFCANE